MRTPTALLRNNVAHEPQTPVDIFPICINSQAQFSKYKVSIPKDHLVVFTVYHEFYDLYHVGYFYFLKADLFFMGLLLSSFLSFHLRM